jgi:hypothetical protein
MKYKPNYFSINLIAIVIVLLCPFYTQSQHLRIIRIEKSKVKELKVGSLIGVTTLNDTLKIGIYRERDSTIQSYNYYWRPEGAWQIKSFDLDNAGLTIKGVESTFEQHFYLKDIVQIEHHPYYNRRFQINLGFFGLMGTLIGIPMLTSGIIKENKNYTQSGVYVLSSGAALLSTAIILGKRSDAKKYRVIAIE